MSTLQIQDLGLQSLVVLFEIAVLGVIAVLDVTCDGQEGLSRRQLSYSRTSPE